MLFADDIVMLADSNRKNLERLVEEFCRVGELNIMVNGQMLEKVEVFK